MSIVSLSILVTGEGVENRKKKSLEIAADLSSKYDTELLDTAENRGIDQIRIILQKINKAPLNSKYTSLIIIEAQNLTLEAQNALLKSLEEPPKRGRIILTAPTREAVLATVSSRCEQITLNPNPEKGTRYEKLAKSLSENFYDRFEYANKLDFDLWLRYWREVLLKRVSQPGEASENQKTKSVLNYIKLILKLKSLKKKNASTKLLNTIILLQAPVSSIEN